MIIGFHCVSLCVHTQLVTKIATNSEFSLKDEYEGRKNIKNVACVGITQYPTVCLELLRKTTGFLIKGRRPSGRDRTGDFAPLS